MSLGSTERFGGFVEIDGERVPMTDAEVLRTIRAGYHGGNGQRRSTGSKTRDDFLQWLVREHGFSLEVPFPGVSGEQGWRWDAARADLCVAFEYSGVGPGHRFNAGVTRDYRKLTEGQLAGWVVIVCNHETVNSGKCAEYIECALQRTE